MILSLASFVVSGQTYSGEGGTVSTSAIAGSTGSWNNTGNAVVDDDSRATNSSSLSGTQYTNYLIVTNFGLSVPTSESISGVEFTIQKSKSGGTFAYLGDYSVRLMKSGVMVGNDNASAFPWFGFDIDQAYGSSTDLWGTTISPADVNKAGFGVAIAAQRYFGFGSMTPRIDNVSVTIHTTAPLPVELTYFEADNQENSVVLNWVTNSEVENDYFEIQVSKDGYTFQTVARHEGQGNTTEVTNYSYEDTRVTSGVTYYRLKQVDFDGTTAYSDAKVVDRGEEQGEFVIFPNPVIDQFTISNIDNSDHTVEIYNMSGQLVKTEIANGRKTINTSGMPSGYYTVKVTSATQSFIKKIIIK